MLLLLGLLLVGLPLRSSASVVHRPSSSGGGGDGGLTLTHFSNTALAGGVRVRSQGPS
jgi:hypothetical protein